MSELEKPLDTNDIMVSVIVLTYNHEKYIRQALDSILAQEVDFKYEILIGDDASTDGTSAIVREYAEKYPNIIRAFVHKENMGATKNLSDMLCLARGQYIAHLEGDDFWCDATKLCRQVSFLEDHRSYIGCTHRCCVVDEGGELLSRQYISWVCHTSEYSTHCFKGLLLPGHPSTLVYRNFFTDCVDEWRSVIECDTLIGDRSLALLLMARGRLRQLSQVMSCYRQRTEQNATTVAYTLNSDCIHRDYEYTRKLEYYAKEMGVDGGFSSHYRDLFVSAVRRAVRGEMPGGFALAREIMQEGNSVAYILYLPLGLIKKVIQRLKR